MQQEWIEADTPTDGVLYEVVSTEIGPVAIGASGVVIAERDDDEWTTVVPAGPATDRNELFAADVTDDNKRVWFAGSSGALGCYDVETGRKHDYTAPKEKTSTWEAIAVTGDRRAERLRVANGSGEILSMTTDEHGCPQWESVTEPGMGTTIRAMDGHEGRFYAADTTGHVFEEVDGAWTRIGIENAQVEFLDLQATDDHLYITGEDGRFFRYDRDCGNWTPLAVGDGSLRTLHERDGSVVVAGDDGQVYERTEFGWRRTDTPIEADIRATAPGEADVAVGENGAIIKRRRVENDDERTDTWVD